MNGGGVNGIDAHDRINHNEIKHPAEHTQQPLNARLIDALRVLGKLGSCHDGKIAVSMYRQGVIEHLLVNTIRRFHHVGDGVSGANVEVSRDAAANQIQIQQNALGIPRQ